jgi:Fe-S-cluster-containing dehydrogenase component/formate-dependent nitrite reductase membrane component NrfD
MNYGFLINNQTCIGCHACSVACKSENEVPLGVNRTWVKYVEKGQFPHTRRLFQVTRCNHCANPPCVRICPVTAMYQRHDGIVEFDPEVCIGCKACMQACPYDAIYLDPETNSAAKCHYCAHRVDLGLETACVIVCPTQSIIAGDMDDSNSLISRLISRQQVNVRKPEQGTAPKLFYIEGDDVALTPTASSANFMWADLVTEQEVRLPEDPPANGHNGGGPLKTAHSGNLIRTPAAQGAGYRGPIHLGEGRVAEQMVQTTYNAQHQVPWHWPVPAYLVTKGIGSGVFALLAIFFGLDLVDFDPNVALWGNLISLLFIGLTTLLLVMDLAKPKLFYTILTRPQWRSWLTRGAFILIGFSILAGLWFVTEGAALLGIIPATAAGAARLPLLGLGFLLAILSAIYTAFLFGQAEGRDLWQSPLLPVHLVIQALMVGSAVLLGLGLVITLPPSLVTGLAWVFGITLLLDLFVTLLGEFGMPHASEVAAQAAHQISAGKYCAYFWHGSVVLGHIVPLVILLVAAASGDISPWLMAIAAVATIIGLYLFEYAFVMAPQEVPNS